MTSLDIRDDYIPSREFALALTFDIYAYDSRSDVLIESFYFFKPKNLNPEIIAPHSRFDAVMVSICLV